MRHWFIIISVFFPSWCSSQSAMPSWGVERVKKISAKYAVEKYLQPHFLEQDFSGDGVYDLAVLIESKEDRKKGILIMFGKSERSFIVGAGESIGSAGDNFDWAGTWSIYNDLQTFETTFDLAGDVAGSKPIILKHPSIQIRQDEGSGGLIYFDGTKFIWIHQGD